MSFSFSFLFLYDSLSFYYTEKKAWNERERPRKKRELCETDRQNHANKCLIKQSEPALEAYGKQTGTEE